jgi:heat shock protein 1/8
MAESALKTTVSEIDTGIYEVIACSVENRFGGRAVTEMLMNYVTSKYEINVPDDDMVAKQQLEELCIKIKEKLSDEELVTELYEGKDVIIRRKELENACVDLFAGCMDVIDHVLQKANKSKDKVIHVVLSGGSSKIPKVQKLLKEKFPTTKIYNTIDPSINAVIGGIEASKVLKKDRGLICILDLSEDSFAREEANVTIY